MIGEISPRRLLSLSSRSDMSITRARCVRKSRDLVRDRVVGDVEAHRRHVLTEIGEQHVEWDGVVEAIHCEARKGVLRLAWARRGGT